MRLAILLLLTALAAPLAAQTLYRTSGAGNFSDTTKWVGANSPCGSAGNGVFVSIQHTMTLDCDLGTVATGINTLRVEAAGSLCSYDGSHAGACGNTATVARTIYLNSTGTNAVGSGTSTNPGSDATSMGLFTSYGTFDWRGSATALLTIRPADATHPVWVSHQFNSYSGCTAIGTGGCTGGAAQSTHGAVFRCYYCLLQEFGSSSGTANFEGVAFELRSGEVTPTSALDIQNTELDSMYEFTYAGCASCTMNSNWTLKNLWLNAPTGQYVGNWSNSSTTGFGFDIENVTETGATTTGQTFRWDHRPGAMTFTGNVTIGNSAGTVQRGLGFINGAAASVGPWTLNGNLNANAEGTVASGSNFLDLSFASTDSASTVHGNVCWGSYQCLHFTNPSGSATGPTIDHNWAFIYKEAIVGQGAFFSSGFYFPAIQNNIIGIENDTGAGGSIGLLCYSASGGTAVCQMDNNTIYFATTGTQGEGVNLGDTNGSTTHVASPSWFRSNIIAGPAYGFINNAQNAYSTAQCASATTGVCSNLVYNTTNDWCGNGTTCNSHGSGSGYDNGTLFHPNAVYGDTPDATAPNFYATSRRPTDYDTFCGGAGTLASLGTQFSYRTGAQVGSYNSCYTVSAMLAFLQQGFQTQNTNLVGKGFGGTYLGAVPPAPPHPQANYNVGWR